MLTLAQCEILMYGCHYKRGIRLIKWNFKLKSVYIKSCCKLTKKNIND